MTESEMRAAAERLRKIERARENLAAAQERLDLVNKYGKAGSKWRPSLCIKKADPYSYGRDVEIAITIPFGVIQQQAVYEVEAARREIVKLGGSL